MERVEISSDVKDAIRSISTLLAPIRPAIEEYKHILIKAIVRDAPEKDRDKLAYIMRVMRSLDRAVGLTITPNDLAETSKAFADLTRPIDRMSTK